jgi:prepilin-type N-terminal cleavage/methylation domain-containing protein
MKKHKGFTLIELIVSLVIFGFVMAAVLSVFIAQQQKTHQVREVSSLQIDAQIAFEVIKRDLAMAGFGLPGIQAPIRDSNGGSSASDEITVYGITLGMELDRLNYNVVLDDIAGSDEVIINYWTRGVDKEKNISPGDIVIAVSSRREPINIPPGTVVLDTFHNMNGEFVAKLSNAVNLSSGSIIYGVRNTSIYTGGVNYSLGADRILRRNGDIFLENVEDIQFAYGIDGAPASGNDPDGIIDPTEWYNSISDAGLQPIDLYGRTFAIRVTLIVRSKGIPGFSYETNTITVEDRIINLSPADRRFDRIILQGVVYPSNIIFF